MPTPTTRRSRTARRWPATSPRAARSPWSRAPPGEQGEVLVPELEQLAAEDADQLGGYRLSELRAAIGPLGVTDLRFLGGIGPYRDSGMRGTTTATRSRPYRGRPRTPSGTPTSRGGRPRWSPSSARSGRRSWSPTTRTAATATPTTSRRTGCRCTLRRGGRAVLPRRPRRAVGRRQGLLGRDVCESRFRSMLRRRCARRGTPRPSRGWTPTATSGRGGGRPTPPTSPPAWTAHRPPRHQAGRSLRGTAAQVEADGRVLREVPRTRPVDVSAREFYRLAKGKPGPVGDDGWEDDLFAGL